MVFTCELFPNFWRCNIESMLVYHGILVVGYPDLNTLGIILLAVCNIIGAHRRRVEKRTIK